MVHGNNNYLKIDGRSNRVGTFTNNSQQKYTKNVRHATQPFFFTEQMDLRN